MSGINWTDLWSAIALMLVLEGILPFISPDRMRGMMRLMSEMDSRQLRISGLSSMILGLLLLYLVKG
jgi:uncharacterized protein YjeT (DUF2065 family)